MSLTYPGTHPSGGTGDGRGAKQLAQHGADQQKLVYRKECGYVEAEPNPVIPSLVVRAPLRP